MKILIKNANLISMEEKRPQLEENIDILIEENKIKKIEKNIEEKAEKVIDAKGKFVMPGLIDTHAHVPMSIFRETLDGYNLEDWLNQKIWPMEDKLNEEDIYYASILSYLEMIYSGTTCINDMYFMEEKIVEAAKLTGIRLQVTRTLMDLNGSGEERLEELEKFIQKYNNKDELISLNVGIHGLYTNSSDYIQKAIELAKKNNLIINMHFCENARRSRRYKKNV